MSSKLSLLVSFLGADRLSGTIRNISRESKKAGEALKAMNANARSQKRELADLRRQIAGSTGDVTELQARERELERQLERTNSDIEQQKKQLTELSAIDRATAERVEASQKLIASGQADIAQGLGLAAPLILAGKAAMDNEKSLALMAQKLDLSKAETDKLGASMLRTAIATKQLPENIITAADFLASKGLGQKEVEGMLPVLGKFGTAWDANVSDAAKAAHANMLSLKVPLNQTAAALQIMAVAGQKGGFEVKNMAAEFPELASQMATLGSTGLDAVADLSSALQVIEAKTGDGAQAANNLNNMMRFVGSKEGIDRFKKLGIDIPAALKKAAKEGRSPLETIAKLTNKATGGDDAKLGLIFSDAQALAGVRALIQSEEEYIAIRKAALNARGMTEKEFTRMSATANANWVTFQGSMQGLVVTLGTHLLPLLTDGVKWITGVSQSVVAWAQANPETAASIMKLAAGLAVFKVGLGVTKIALGAIIGPIAKFWGFIQRMRAVGAAAKALWLLRSGLWVAGKAALWLGRALMANPIGLIVGALAIAAYLIYTHWDTIKAAFWSAVGWLGETWSLIKAKFADGVAFLQTLPGRMIGLGKNIVQGLVAGILAAPGAVWNALKRIVNIGIDGVKNFLGIKSPSRLFMALGGHVSSGMALGIDGGRGRAMQSAQRLASGVASAGAPRLAAAAGQPIRAAAGAGAANAFGGGAPLTINFTINALPGQDVNELADKIVKKIERMAGVARRSSYEDD
jgi:TP901 family phage tail tape measure protein